MNKLTFSTTGCWDQVEDFGCASLGLAGICDNTKECTVTFPTALESVYFTGSYESILQQVSAHTADVKAAILVFGNAGGENAFLAKLQQIISCPIVGGGAAIDGTSGRSALITGNGEAALFLITDDRFTYEAQTQCIHDEILETCTLTTADPRTILTINGMDAAEFLIQKKKMLGLEPGDFEHLTLSDIRNVNAHLSEDNGVVKSGRDVQKTMLLRYVSHDKVYDRMYRFYDDPNAIVFGCAGLSGLLDRPLDTNSLGLFLFGEVCTVDGIAEFGNLMLSKLVIKSK